MIRASQNASESLNVMEQSGEHISYICPPELQTSDLSNRQVTKESTGLDLLPPCQHLPKLIADSKVTE